MLTCIGRAAFSSIREYPAAQGAHYIPLMHSSLPHVPTDRQDGLQDASSECNEDEEGDDGGGESCKRLAESVPGSDQEER